MTGVPWRASIDGALVEVAGELSIQVPEDALRTLLTEQFFDPAQIEEIMTGLPAYLRSMAIASPIAVVEQSGAWLVCSGVLAFISPPSASPSPAAS